MADLITYRGESMTPDWPAKIAAAQSINAVFVEGVTYLRIPFGMEPWWDEVCPPPTAHCRDCGVLPGEWHVSGCCVECCPICREGQRLICRDHKE